MVLSEASARRLGNVMLAIALVSQPATVALGIITDAADRHPVDDIPTAGAIAFLVVQGTFAIMGWLVVRHAPVNPLGWVLLGMALVVGVGMSTEGYAVHAVIDRPDPLAGGVAAAWVGFVLLGTSAPTFAGMVALFYLFPTGRLASPRWKPLGVLAAVAFTVTFLVEAMHPGPLPAFPGVQNPIGAEWLDHPALYIVLYLLSLVATILGVVSLVLRYRRSSGTERQQIKWFAAAGLFFALVVLQAPLWWDLFPDIGFYLWPLQLAAALMFVPVSVAIAILRYRLYDIDRLISRTVSWAIVTGLLVSVYLGAVVTLGALARSLLGSSNESLVVAGSTLLASAAFVPIRGRVQRVIDHRFNRASYDAAAAVDSLGARLLTTVELTEVESALTSSVSGALQPSRVGVWIPTAASGRSSRDE